ncbi:MAG: hypothetical protein QXI39_08695 [Candidatus Bathyarchaeia archaeon]
MRDPLGVLYKALVNGGSIDIKPPYLDEAIEYARLNKVLLQFLRASRIEGESRRAEEGKLADTIRNVEEVNHKLKGLNYAFYKLVKPVVYAPSDIDILIGIEDLEEAAYRLRDLGFRTTVVEPYCITMSRLATIVDLYVHPTLGGMIYMDGQELLTHMKLAKYHSVEVPCLEKYAEALVAATHALYKERLYTLNDYITIKKWMSNETMMLAEIQKCKPSLDLAVKLNDLIERGIIKTPHKLSMTTWIKLFGQKIIEDPLSRVTCKNLIGILMSSHGIEKIKSKMIRRTY